MGSTHSSTHAANVKPLHTKVTEGKVRQTELGLIHHSRGKAMAIKTLWRTATNLDADISQILADESLTHPDRLMAARDLIRVHNHIKDTIMRLEGV